MNKRNALSSLVFLVAFLTLSSVKAETLVVKNELDHGPGSLRWALGNGAKLIRIPKRITSIKVTQPLEYNGGDALRIVGNGQVLDASSLSNSADIFTVSNGANLEIENLNFFGPDFNVNRTPNVPTGGKGIFVKVPKSRTGVVRVDLRNVTVTGVGNHGIHISDCTLGDDCGSGNDGSGLGSPSSVQLNLSGVTVDRVGFGRQDADGVRVDERGEGSIYFSAVDSSFVNVGADGIELDEGNAGDVVADVRDSVLDRNGEYCKLVTFAENGPCDDEGAPDLDDGFDIDEAGLGSIFVQVSDSFVRNNFDEGLDFDEEGPGDISMRILSVMASGNNDEGIKASEENDGSVVTTLRNVILLANNGSKEGVEIEEESNGDVTATVVRSSFLGGDDEGLKIEQLGSGSGSLKLNATKVSSLNLEGVVSQ